MIRGLTSAARGMIQQSAKQDIIAHNLANIATPGFKSRRAAAHDFAAVFGAQSAAQRPTAAGNPRPALAAPVADPVLVTSRSQAQGSLQRTGTKTDLAIEGPGFFIVDGPGGSSMTRNGSFTLNAVGELVTSAGENVLGEAGPIKVGSADWSIDSSGAVIVDGAVVDRLRIVISSDEGQTVNAAPDERRVTQGAVESSNVAAVGEMVATIANMRAYEANQKVIQSIDQTLDKLINEAGRV